jgi:thiosulfate reductase/polysulfide reductase chain A
MTLDRFGKNSQYQDLRPNPDSSSIFTKKYLRSLRKYAKFITPYVRKIVSGGVVMAKEEIKKVGCCFCAVSCGMLVHIQDGRIIKVEPNREHRLSRGFSCQRMQYAIKWLYHPDQLMYPLKRQGQRGEGKWQRITSAQAIEEIAAKLNMLKANYGPQMLAVIEGTYRGENIWARSRFCNLFGNPQNVFHPGVICGLNCLAMEQAMMGDSVMATPDIARTNCLVLSGMRPHESSPRTLASILKRRQQIPLKLIVIDPIATRIAQDADMYLQIRPGTDAALFMGWINVIINERLFDMDFINRWTTGFDKLARRAQEYTPERVAQISGISVEQIIASARLYATTKPATIYRGVAPDQIGPNSSRASHARNVLRVITGNIDIPGGDLIPSVGPVINGKMFIRDTQMELTERLPEAIKKLHLGWEKAPLMTWRGYELTNAPWQKLHKVSQATMHRLGGYVPALWRAILTEKPYPIKAVITWGANPLMWAANTKDVYQALKSPNLELNVVQEFWMTPSAQLADYVLPAASWLERPMCSTQEDNTDVVWGGERAIQPMGERKDDYTLWRDLGLAVGQDKNDWPWEALEEVIAYRLKPLGISYEEFIQTGYILGIRKYKKYEEEGFATASGKVELYSTVLEKLGEDPLPYYQEPPESPVSAPEVAKEYPLILNTGGRFMPMFHSEHRQLGIGMRERHPDPLVTIHPETAKSLSIREGDWVWIQTTRGRIKQKASYNHGILPNVVNVEASWWFPEKPGQEPSLFGLWESNANVLTADEDEFCDPLTGGWANRALLCKVYRVDEEK